MIQFLSTFYSQLFYDGHPQIASQLAAAVMADPPCPPSDRLMNVVLVGLQHEPERHKKDPIPGLNPIQEILVGPGLGIFSLFIPFEMYLSGE